MLSVANLYAQDFNDGSLEQMMISGHAGTVIAAAKASAHWTVTGAPLVIAAPLIGLLLDVSSQALLTLVVSLLLGTPILSLLGGMGAALTLGLRSAGVLLILLILPLSIPALIFGAGAVGAMLQSKQAFTTFSDLNKAQAQKEPTTAASDPVGRSRPPSD
jgi:heme exporter protein B